MVLLALACLLLVGCSNGTTVAVKPSRSESHWLDLSQVEESVGPFLVDIPEYFAEGPGLSIKVGEQKVDFVLATQDSLVMHCDVGSGFYIHTFALYKKQKAGHFRIAKYYIARQMSTYKVDRQLKRIVIQEPSTPPKEIVLRLD